MSSVITAGESNFKTEVLDSDIPVLLDFWAPWCGPCKALNPVLEDVATKFAGRAKVVKVNIEDSPEIKEKYPSRGIPHLLLLDKGEVVANVGRIRTRSGLTEIIEGHIAGQSRDATLEANLSDVNMLRAFITDADIERVKAVFIANPKYIETDLGGGMKPLMLTVRMQKHDRTDLLLELGAKASLAALAGAGKADLLAEALKLNPNVNEPDEAGVLPLYIAITNGHRGCIDLLIDAGVDLNWVSPDGGARPYLWAVSFGDQIETLKYLVNKGMDIKQPVRRGDTLLHIAAYTAEPELAIYLLDQGHDHTLTNNKGQTPLDMARLGVEKAPACQAVIDLLEAL